MAADTLRQSPHGDGQGVSHPPESLVPAAPFRSILFGDCATSEQTANPEVPEYFGDLNLDQIVDSITAGRDEYDLKPFFYSPLTSINTIRYRQAVFCDLEAPALFKQIHSFSEQMRTTRACTLQAGKLYYKYQKHALFLRAVEIYGAAVSRLVEELSSARVESCGFQALRDYLVAYAQSSDFRLLVAESERLRSDLDSIRYSVQISDRRVTIGKYGGEPDLSTEVLRTFEKFRQGASREYQFSVASWTEMNHVEAAIVDRVARIHPDVFSRLDEYPERHSGYLDPVIAAFDREVQFYLAYIEFKQRIGQAGLSFSYPEIAESKEIHGHDIFDLALANSFVDARRPVVTNSFFLSGPERVFVVSGPNQGGKTTFARTFGQLHYLGCLGCPVPGTDSKLFLFDKLFTHFERQEDLQNLSGKLEDELLRIHRILEQATPNSILIMNESFLSTTLNNALFLSKEIMQRILSLDMLCVTVTFLDELASMADSTVSMVSTVDPKDPALRTFKIVRKPADGLAYAALIAQKHRLTQDAIVNRVSENAGRVNLS